MKQVLTDFIASKKAIAFILGLIVTLLCHLLQVDTEAVYQCCILTTAYIFGQGVADYGKAAEQLRLNNLKEAAADFNKALSRVKQTVDTLNTSAPHSGVQSIDASSQRQPQ